MSISGAGEDRAELQGLQKWPGGFPGREMPSVISFGSLNPTAGMAQES